MEVTPHIFKVFLTFTNDVCVVFLLLSWQVRSRVSRVWQAEIHPDKLYIYNAVVFIGLFSLNFMPFLHNGVYFLRLFFNRTLGWYQGSTLNIGPKCCSNKNSTSYWIFENCLHHCAKYPMMSLTESLNTSLYFPLYENKWERNTPMETTNAQVFIILLLPDKLYSFLFCKLDIWRHWCCRWWSTWGKSNKTKMYLKLLTKVISTLISLLDLT